MRSPPDVPDSLSLRALPRMTLAHAARGAVVRLGRVLTRPGATGVVAAGVTAATGGCVAGPPVAAEATGSAPPTRMSWRCLRLLSRLSVT